MAHAFSLQNNLKQGDALLPFIISFSLVYGIRKIKETQLPYVEYWKYNNEFFYSAGVTCTYYRN